MKKYSFIVVLVFPLIVFSQAGTEIFLLDVHWKGKTISLNNPINITNHIGYDNQPFFDLKKPVIYYTSDRDSMSNTDIKIYNYKTNVSSFLTNTPVNEYSPTETPDGKFISCIIARKKPFAQDLGKYPIKGGAAEILINNMVVGYHSWIDDHRLLLFILDDTAHNSLHYYDLLTKEDRLIIKTPGRSLSKIPGQHAMSFIDKTDPKIWLIKRLELLSQQVSVITPTLPGQENMVWTKNGMIIMSDGTDLFYFDPKNKGEWSKINFIQHNPAIKGITRLALNADNSKMAIVVKE